MSIIKKAVYFVLLSLLCKVEATESLNNTIPPHVWQRCIDQENNLESKVILLDTACELFRDIDTVWFNTFSESACLTCLALMTESDDVGDKCHFGLKALDISERYEWQELSSEIQTILINHLLIEGSNKYLCAQLHFIDRYIKALLPKINEEIDRVRAKLLLRQSKEYQDSVQLFETTILKEQSQDHYASADRHKKLTEAIKVLENMGIPENDPNLQKMYKQFILDFVPFLYSCTNASDADQAGRIIGIYKMALKVMGKEQVLNELADCIIFKFLPLFSHNNLSIQFVNTMDQNFKMRILSKYLDYLDHGLSATNIQHLQAMATNLLRGEDEKRFKEYYVKKLLENLYESISNNKQEEIINILNKISLYNDDPLIIDALIKGLEKVYRLDKVMFYIIGNKFFDFKSLGKLFLSFPPQEINVKLIRSVRQNYGEICQSFKELTLLSAWSDALVSCNKNVDNLVLFLNSLGPIEPYIEHIGVDSLKKYLAYYVENIGDKSTLLRKTKNFHPFIKKIIFQAVMKKGRNVVKNLFGSDPLEIYEYAESIDCNKEILNHILELTLESINIDHIGYLHKIIEKLPIILLKKYFTAAFFKSLSGLSLSSITPFLVSQKRDLAKDYLLYYLDNSSQYQRDACFSILCILDIAEDDELHQTYLERDVNYHLNNNSLSEALKQAQRISDLPKQKHLILKIWKLRSKTNYSSLKDFNQLLNKSYILEFVEEEIGANKYYDIQALNTLSVLSLMMRSSDDMLYPGLRDLIKERVSFIFAPGQLDSYQPADKIEIFDSLLNIIGETYPTENIDLSFMDFLYNSYNRDGNIKMINSYEKVRNIFLLNFIKNIDSNLLTEDVDIMSTLFLNLDKTNYSQPFQISDTSFKFVSYYLSKTDLNVKNYNQLNYLNAIGQHYENLNNEQKVLCAAQLKRKLSLTVIKEYDFLNRFGQFNASFQNLIIDLLIELKQVYPLFFQKNIDQILENLRNRMNS